MSIKLRPHHLLCTQGYSGKGYSREFTEHMDELVNRLRTEEHTEISLVFGTDDLCEHCPNKLGDDLCSTQEKVKRYDRKVVEYFQLEEKVYCYKELIQKIDHEMTEEMMDDICGDCSWYPISHCKKNVIKESRY